MRRRFLNTDLLKKDKSKDKLFEHPSEGDVYISKINLRLYVVGKMSGRKSKIKTVCLIDKNPTLLLPDKVEEKLSNLYKNYLLLSSGSQSNKRASIEDNVGSIKVGRWYCSKLRPRNYHMVVASESNEGSVVLSHASCKAQHNKKVGMMKLLNEYEPVVSANHLPLLPQQSRWVWHSNFSTSDTSYMSKIIYLLFDYGDKVAISSKKNSYLCDMIDKSEFLLYYTRVD